VSNLQNTNATGWLVLTESSLHPDLLPGGYLWADYMLHDLQKAVSSWGSRWRMLGQ
jgi:hypothetical protein